MAPEKQVLKPSGEVKMGLTCVILLTAFGGVVPILPVRLHIAIMDLCTKMLKHNTFSYSLPMFSLEIVYLYLLTAV